jgi:neutral ceramidase
MKYSLGGYGARMSKPAEGIHDDIWVKALVLSDGNKKYALITMDILAIPPNVKPAVIEVLEDEDWKMENLMILPSHSHTSLDMSALNDKNTLNNPYIGIYQPKLLQFVVEKIVSALKSADQELQPVMVDTKRKRLDDLNRNRRNDEATDRDLTVTRIDRKNGSPLVILISWTAHPTIMSDKDMLVSSGWPGYLQRELEAWIGRDVVCMYYNGAQGDQSVRSDAGGSHYEKAEKYGRIIARNAYHLYNNIDPAAKSVFSYNSCLTDLPQPRMHPMFNETGGDEYGMDEETSAYILSAMCPRQSLINALRIGDWLVVGAPGELTAVIGEELKKELYAEGIKIPTIGGIANEWLSYITSPEQYKAGGYETSVNFYGPELGPVVSKAMIEASLPLID